MILENQLKHLIEKWNNLQFSNYPEYNIQLLSRDQNAFSHR